MLAADTSRRLISNQVGRRLVSPGGPWTARMRRVANMWARPVALGVIRVRDELLVFRGYDQSKGET